MFKTLSRVTERSCYKGNIIHPLQGISKRLFPGCENMWWNNCVFLPALDKQIAIFSTYFTQPGKSLLEILCSYKCLSPIEVYELAEQSNPYQRTNIGVILTDTYTCPWDSLAGTWGSSSGRSRPCPGCTSTDLWRRKPATSPPAAGGRWVQTYMISITISQNLQGDQSCW